MAQDINLHGWVKLRRGVLTHLQTGLMTITEFTVFHILLILADKATGSGKVNAKAITFWSDGQISEDMAERALRKLEEKDYIVREIVPGRHGVYVFHVQKYVATAGADEGKVLTFTKKAKVVEKIADILEGFEVEPADEESAVRSAQGSEHRSAVRSAQGSDNTRRETGDRKPETGEVSKQVRKEGSEGASVASLPSPTSTSSSDPKAVGSSVPNNNPTPTQRERIRAHGESYRLCFGLNPTEEMSFGQLEDFAEVWANITECYAPDNAMDYLQQFLAWNKTHKPEKMWIRGAERLKKVWFSNDENNGRRQFEDHNPKTCKVCMATKKQATGGSGLEYRDAAKYGSFATRNDAPTVEDEGVGSGFNLDEEDAI